MVQPASSPLPALANRRANRCRSCAAGNAGLSARGLATFRLTNAERFFRSAEEDRPHVTFAIALYHSAIAIELGLNAWLLHAGFEDCWICRNIRHDIDKALAYAEASGLGPAPDELAETVAILSPYYRRHGIDELAHDPRCPLGLDHVRRIVRGLLDAVADATGHKRARAIARRAQKARHADA